ncbi:MAG: protein kinase [Blastocatellia bacterium]|nr:protein kinase [Blastocatellia bacterium]
MPPGIDTKGDILIVDDNPINLNLLSSMLLERKYHVRVATSGKRALAATRSALPDLIMLDITMPEMDGYEVCHQLKSDPKTHDVPVIFISALDEAMDKVRAFEVGGVDYVTKPFQFEEVLARIENQLKISRLQKEMEAKNLELARKNEELMRSKEELVASYKRAELIFSALTEVLPGTVLDDKYRLEKKIGTGGFGSVYQATHLALNRHVAVKIFQPRTGNAGPSDLERFRLEGVSACRINHPNAVTVMDFGISSAGIAYLVMELLQGQTLTKELARKKVLSPERAAEIILPVCEALAEAHRANIVHRDIKPDNIFLHQTSNGEEVVKVVDFGLAKLLGETNVDLQHITVGKIIGTPTYMSPERLGNLPYDGKTDIYSLGITLYQMLCGQPPFFSKEGDICTVAVMHLTKEPKPMRELNPHIPPSVENLVMRTLSKSPDKRPTAKELTEELLAALDNTKRVRLTISGSFPVQHIQQVRAEADTLNESYITLNNDR